MAKGTLLILLTGVLFALIGQVRAARENIYMKKKETRIIPLKRPTKGESKEVERALKKENEREEPYDNGLKQCQKELLELSRKFPALSEDQGDDKEGN